MISTDQELDSFVAEYRKADSDEERRKVRGEYARLGYNKRELDEALRDRS